MAYEKYGVKIKRVSYNLQRNPGFVKSEKKRTKEMFFHIISIANEKMVVSFIKNCYWHILIVIAGFVFSHVATFSNTCDSKPWVNKGSMKRVSAPNKRVGLVFLSVNFLTFRISFFPQNMTRMLSIEYEIVSSFSRCTIIFQFVLFLFSFIHIVTV